MAASRTSLEVSGSSTNATSYTTGSVSAAEGEIIEIFVVSRNAAATAVTLPTISATGLTFTNQKDGSSTDGLIAGRVATAPVGAGGFSGTISINYGAETQANCSWHIYKLAEINTSAPVVQAGTVQRSNGAGNFTVTLSAFADATNNLCVAYSAWANTDASVFINYVAEFTADAQRDQESHRSSTASQTGEDTSFGVRHENNATYNAGSLTNARSFAFGIEYDHNAGGGGGGTQPPRSMHQFRLRQAA